jgi:uncharacterized membrane protein
MTALSESARPSGVRRFWGLRPKVLLFALIALMYGYVLWTNERFLFNPDDPEWRHIAPFRWLLLPHGMVAALALFLGPLQFSDRLRRRFANLHRVLGYLYVTGVFIGAPLGLYIEWFEERLGYTRSFTIATGVDGANWILATAMALFFIRQGKIEQHRRWMTRSFACSLIFLEARAILTLFNLPAAQAETVLWCCIAAAYPLADLVLQVEELRRQRPRPARVVN